MSEYTNLKGKHIILGINGGIAAYKSAMLARLFVKNGAEVQVIMTPNGREFISPVTLSTLTGNPVITEFFTANTGEWHSHVNLGLWADAMIVAPATASTLAKMSTGVADNMLVTTYLSSRCPVFIAPAMDLDMWAHPTTSRNIERLLADGVRMIEPESGELASHLSGKGRMAEPEKIAEAIDEFFGCDKKTLNGKKILITAGPTYENIDPVRFIGNYSSGKMGYALAAEAAKRGAEVVLISGPVSLATPDGVERIDVVSAKQMHEVCIERFGSTDIAILCAAVADYAPAECHDTKLKREKTERLTIELVRNPDIAASLGNKKHPGQTLVGFALETNNEEENALGKMHRKKLDFIVLNSMRDKNACFGVDTNKVTIFAANGDKTITDTLPKSEIAAKILDTIMSDRK